MSEINQEDLIHRAADVISSAEAILIGAGAGMGVDSGLPDFRGDQGFWKAYPPYAKLGLKFVELASPIWFMTDRPLAWGFYGHRLMLYRATVPHDGFTILKRWGAKTKHGSFVFTSNVDGHFQKAGFTEDQIVECHGSIHWMQCTKRCGIDPFPADSFNITIDEETMRAQAPLPDCPACGALARPNILMFSDWDWDSERTDQQQSRLEKWLRRIDGSKFVIIECGAGQAIPTVRMLCDRVAQKHGATLVRINPRESHVPSGQIGLPMNALEALQAIDGALLGRQ